MAVVQALTNTPPAISTMFMLCELFPRWQLCNYIPNSKAYRPVKSRGRNGHRLAVIITEREQTYLPPVIAPVLPITTSLLNRTV